MDRRGVIADTELKVRIREIIGDEAGAAFARRCGFPESLLRKYLNGSQPSVRNLVVMARAAGVSVEWLATGKNSAPTEMRAGAPDARRITPQEADLLAAFRALPKPMRDAALRAVRAMLAP